MAPEHSPHRQLAEIGHRLFPRLDEDERLVQRLVGVVGGIGTILVGLVNWSSVALSFRIGPLQSFLTSYVGLIVVMGAVSLACGFWYTAVARSIHIVLFVFAGIFGALGANRGNVTSGFFIVLAIVVLLEYKVDRRVALALGLTIIAGYFAALAVGYRDDVDRPVISALASMITLLTFVGLFGGMTLRHRLLEQRNAKILERRIAERTAELNAMLQERTVMLQEIHHRVKNNMQTVSTLLSMEIDRLPDSEGREALLASDRRIMAMSQVHDALYGSGRTDRVDLGAYTRDLLDALLQTGSYRTELELAAPDAVDVSLSFASSYGLVLNELVTNTLRHAFEPGQTGRLSVAVERYASLIRLRVRDDGRGLPEGFSLETNAGVGMSIVTSIVQHLEGSIEYSSADGVRWSVEFPAARAG